MALAWYEWLVDGGCGVDRASACEVYHQGLPSEDVSTLNV
jgi:hypothetical protein